MTTNDGTAVDRVFQQELARRGLDFERTEEGLYKILIGEVTATINLENVRRDYLRDGDLSAVARFAEQLDVEMFDQTPAWKDVRPFLRYTLEPADYESGLEDALHESVTDDLVKLFVFVSSDGSRITWVTHEMLGDWQVAKKDVAAVAEQNMDDIVRAASLEVDEIGGAKLGMLVTEETPFKASLILSQQFRSLVEPTFRWPVYVVAPARDFVYVLAAHDRQFLGRLGRIVLREFNESGYSITADVLEVGNDGVKAIGGFGPRA